MGREEKSFGANTRKLLIIPKMTDVSMPCCWCNDETRVFCFCGREGVSSVVGSGVTRSPGIQMHAANRASNRCCNCYAWIVCSLFHPSVLAKFVNSHSPFGGLVNPLLFVFCTSLELNAILF